MHLTIIRHRRPTLRLARSIGLFAALGVATSLTIAWICAAREYPIRMSHTSDLRARDPRTFTAWRYTKLGDRFGSSRWHAFQTPPDATVDPAIGIIPGLPSLAVALTTPEPARRDLLAAGWPFRCLWGGVDIADASRPTISGGATLGFILPIGSVRVFEPPSDRGVRGCMPIGPLPIGLALDTALFAAAWWIALAAPRWLQRLRRSARDQCPACGYNLSGLAACASCPECGSAEATGTRSST